MYHFMISHMAIFVKLAEPFLEVHTLQNVF